MRFLPFGSVFILALFLFSAACAGPAAESPPVPGTERPIPPTSIQGAPSAPPGSNPATEGVDPPGATPTNPHSQTPSVALSPTPSPSPTPCPPASCTAPARFLLARPIAPPGRTAVDPTYRFGTTQNGQREPHHGVEFVNSSGTPVLAAAGGVVVVAGDDEAVIYADWPFFYGNLVVLEHTFASFPEPVYTLYAHLSEVAVSVGDGVAPGQPLGRVGLSGVATGSHLHFEVRIGENQYDAVQNPELWLAPQKSEDGAPYGVLAGRIEDGESQPVYIPNLVVERLTGPRGDPLWEAYLETYVDPDLIPTRGLGENFAIGDLPAGWYRLTFVYRGLQTREVTVTAGELTMVTFTIPD